MKCSGAAPVFFTFLFLLFWAMRCLKSDWLGSKGCGPGIRQSCDALHCGQRHYLHDDLRAITLQPVLIQAPPIELWPAVVARLAAPADVEELLLKPIRAGMQSLPPGDIENLNALARFSPPGRRLRRPKRLRAPCNSHGKRGRCHTCKGLLSMAMSFRTVPMRPTTARLCHHNPGAPR